MGKASSCSHWERCRVCLGAGTEGFHGGSQASGRFSSLPPAHRLPLQPVGNFGHGLVLHSNRFHPPATGSRWEVLPQLFCAFLLALCTFMQTPHRLGLLPKSLVPPMPSLRTTGLTPSGLSCQIPWHLSIYRQGHFASSFATPLGFSSSTAASCAEMYKAITKLSFSKIPTFLSFLRHMKRWAIGPSSQPWLAFANVSGDPCW